MFDGRKCTVVNVVNYMYIKLDFSVASFQEILTTSSMLISSVAASKWDFILSVTVKGNEDWGQKVMAMWVN